MTSLTKRSWVLLAAALVFGMLATGAVSRCTTTSEIGRVLEPELALVGAYRGPQWTADGQSLIVEYFEQLYYVEVTGNGLRRISRDGSAQDEFEIDLAPNVSPDGHQIAYTTMRYRTGNWHNFEIATADLNGRNDSRLTDIESLESNPVWSPDGTRIAFLSQGREPGENTCRRFKVYTMAADGTDERSVAPNTYVYYDPPVWSPDGERLAFWSGVTIVSAEDEIYSRTLFTVRADGSELTRVSEALFDWRYSGDERPLSATTFSLPAWSPDSDRIAFVSESGGQGGLFVAAPDGSNVRKIIDPPANSPLWLPDGSTIVYNKGNTLWAVSPDNPSRNWEISSERVLRTSFLSLSPDGSRIAVYDPDFRQDKRLMVISLDGTVTPDLLPPNLSTWER